MHPKCENKDKNGCGSLTALSETLVIVHYCIILKLHMHTLSKIEIGSGSAQGKNPWFFFFFHSVYIVVEDNLGDFIQAK